MNLSSEQSVEISRAMRRQEEVGYSVSDYLSSLPAVATALETPIDASCRYAMAKWCNEIADFCNYKKETVAIAMNCLDRFMSTPNGREILLDRNLYQLAAMTALYSSVKIHEQEAMDPKLVSSLSSGRHSPQAVEAMEFRMLCAIQWKVNPPTAMSFVRSMVDLLPVDFIKSCEKKTILDISEHQTELVVKEYNFCTYDQSSIALACMLNALESLTEDDVFCAQVETEARKIIPIDSAAVRELRIAIYELMKGSSPDIQVYRKSTAKEMGSQCIGAVATQGSSFYSSPRTVAVATSVAQR